MKKISVLIIEDHKTLSLSLSSWLKELFPNLTITHASTGTEGLEFAKTNNPDLALIDIGLPDINGLEVTKSIRKLGLKTEIIILTMLDGEKYRQESFSAGAGSFINKKEMYSKLPSEINSFLSSK